MTTITAVIVVTLDTKLTPTGKLPKRERERVENIIGDSIGRHFDVWNVDIPILEAGSVDVEVRPVATHERKERDS